MVVAHPSVLVAVCVGIRATRGGIDRGVAEWGRRPGGSPFTCPRGSMAAHAAPRPYSSTPSRPVPRPRPRLQRVSSHATLFQIRPLNRLVAIQFAVLKAIKLGECAAVHAPYRVLLIACHLRNDARFAESRRIYCHIKNILSSKSLLRLPIIYLRHI